MRVKRLKVAAGGNYLCGKQKEKHVVVLSMN